MSFFSSILEKLGMGERRGAMPPPGAKAGASRPAATAARTGPTTSTASPVGNPPPAVAASAETQPMSEFDVTARLEQMAARRAQKLNWRQSIVDLLKLLDLDSSLESRKELAKELGAPPEVMQDSAKMNTWLHKAVIRQLAEHGGKVPPELLH